MYCNNWCNQAFCKNIKKLRLALDNIISKDEDYTTELDESIISLNQYLELISPLINELVAGTEDTAPQIVLANELYTALLNSQLDSMNVLAEEINKNINYYDKVAVCLEKIIKVCYLRRKCK